MNKSYAMIFDIDGFVCDSSQRLKRCFTQENIANNNVFLEYSKTIDGDIPIPSGILIAQSLLDSGCECFWLTARGSEGRDLTYKWLIENVNGDIPYENLLMRPHGTCSSLEFKKNSSLKLIEQYHIVTAIDDDIDMCNMYQSIGIPSIHFVVPGVDCISILKCK